MKRITLLLLLAVLLLLAGGAAAMESGNYRLDWFTLAGSGGGYSVSTGFSADFTVGQSTTGTASSPGYQLCLGYWCGTDSAHRVNLPLVLQASP